MFGIDQALAKQLWVEDVPYIVDDLLKLDQDIYCAIPIASTNMQQTMHDHRSQ